MEREPVSWMNVGATEDAPVCPSKNESVFPISLSLQTCFKQLFSSNVNAFEVFVQVEHKYQLPVSSIAACHGARAHVQFVGPCLIKSLLHPHRSTTKTRQHPKLRKCESGRYWFLLFSKTALLLRQSANTRYTLPTRRVSLINQS